MKVIELCRELRRQTGAPLGLCRKVASQYETIEEALSHLHKVSKDYVRAASGSLMVRYFCYFQGSLMTLISIKVTSPNDLGIRSDRVGSLVDDWFYRQDTSLVKGLVAGERFGEGHTNLLSSISLNTGETYDFTDNYCVIDQHDPAGYTYVHGSVNEANLKGGVYLRLSKVVEPQDIKGLAVNFHAILTDLKPYDRKGPHRPSEDLVSRMVKEPLVIGSGTLEERLEDLGTSLIEVIFFY